MKYPKTPLLNALLSNLRKAFFAEKEEISTNALLELTEENNYTRRKFLTDTTKTVGLLGLASTLPLSLFSTPKEENTKLRTPQAKKSLSLAEDLLGLIVRINFKKRHYC